MEHKGEEQVKNQIKETEENDKHKKEHSSLQITLNINFENQKILKVHELSNKRIGILLQDLLLIYDLNTFKKLDEIKLPVVNLYNEGFFDFIELKNSDIVLWSPQEILFYKIFENKYNLYQNMNESIFKENNKNYEIFNYCDNKKKPELNSIYELSNGNLVCCTSHGLVICKRDDNENFIIESIHGMEIDVRKIIEINTNQLILLQRYHYYFWACSRNNFSSHTYSINIYDIETKKLTNLAKSEVSKDNYYGYTLISFLIKNGFLLIRYGCRIDIYDIKNNMLLVNNDQENMVINEERFDCHYKILKDEMDIIFLCNYFNNLFIVKNTRDIPKIYMLQDNSIKYVKEFPYQLKELEGVIKLKNNNLIMYSRNKLVLLNHV